MSYRFIYFEHMGFADIASPDYLLIDGEEYSIRWEADEYFEYRGRARKFPYLYGNFFRRYNSEHVGMRIQLNEFYETRKLNDIIEMTQIKWYTI